MFSPENVKKTNGGLSSLNVVRDESGNQTVLTSLYLENIENINPIFLYIFLIYKILNSILRFCCLPSSVVLGATGAELPYPLPSKRFFAIPLLTK